MPRLPAIILVALLAPAAVPAAAAAQPPAFAPLNAPSGCVGQVDPLGGEDGGQPPPGCAAGKQLIGAGSLAVAPGGERLYVASSRGGVAELAIAGAGLSFASCASDDATGGVPGSYGDCLDGDALGGTFSEAALAVSPDGAQLYVADAAGVAWLTRDPATGALQRGGCAKDVSRGDRCAGTSMLGSPSAIAASPDGRDIYVADAERAAIVTFARDPATGALTAAGCISSSGADGLCAKGAGLARPTAVAVSPDGGAVYAVGTDVDFESDSDQFQTSMAIMARDPSTGLLSAHGCVVTAELGVGACTAVPAIAGAERLAVSPDGRDVYTTPAPDSDTSGALADVRVDAAGVSGGGCLAGPDADVGGCTAVEDLPDPGAVAVSPDGRTVVASSSAGIAGFARDPASGALTQAWCSSSAGACDPDGEEDALRLAFAPDGGALFASDADRNSVLALGAIVSVAPSARVSRDGRRARLSVRCPRVASAACRGTLGLRGGARARFRLAAGRAGGVSVAVPARLARRLRARRGALASLAVHAAGHRSSALPITLRRQ